MKTTSVSDLNDENRLIGAFTIFGNHIRTYDDGYGKVYVLCNSMGLQGIVRASSWEDAYEICEDEFFPEANETLDELEKEYGKEFFDNPIFQEGYGIRPNGYNRRDVIKHGFYSKDLNGESLDILNPKLMAILEIILEVEND